MNNNNDINEDEIRVIGKKSPSPTPPKPFVWWVLGILISLLLLLLVFLFLIRPRIGQAGEKQSSTPTASAVLTEDLSVNDEWVSTYDENHPAEILFRDTLVNHIPLTILTPFNTKAELCVGLFDTNDADILLATQAADIRHDNGKIVGAFVCKGEPKAWGLSKKGYCAIFDDRITVGTADNSPYFEQATEEGGYFFRQYPLVDHGKAVNNNPENESQRRALCQWQGQIHVIVCKERITMNDFSKALEQLGIHNAIYLVGSTAYGYAINPDGVKYYFGTQNARKLSNANYILFRK